MRILQGLIIGMALATSVSLIAQFPVTHIPGTSQIYATAGSAAAPSMAFSAQPGTGMFQHTAGFIDFSISGVPKAYLSPTEFIVASSNTIGWSGNTNVDSGGTDVALARAAAGELTMTTLAFSGLGTPANGSFAFCTDCGPTTAATCPATKASCVCNSGGLGSLAIRVNSLWYCPF